MGVSDPLGEASASQIQDESMKAKPMLKTREIYTFTAIVGQGQI